MAAISEVHCIVGSNPMCDTVIRTFCFFLEYIINFEIVESSGKATCHYMKPVGFNRSHLSLNIKPVGFIQTLSIDLRFPKATYL